MVTRALVVSAYAGVLVAITGVIAWATGRPFLFPSLGPSAYVLATARGGETVTARRVLGGHLVGVLGGLFAYHLLADGLVITAVTPAFALDQLRLAASAILSVVLTTAGMILTETVHPPACATTLIVSLGLLSSFIEGGIIMLSVGVIFGAHTAMTHTIEERQ